MLVHSQNPLFSNKILFIFNKKKKQRITDAGVPTRIFAATQTWAHFVQRCVECVATIDEYWFEHFKFDSIFFK